VHAVSPALLPRCTRKRKGDSNNYGLCTLDQIIPYYGELLYNHACLTYNISMVVKFKANPIEKIRDILRDQNGILLTSDLAKYEIPRTYLSILEMNGEIQRVSRGVYSDTNYMIDEMVSIQSRYKGAIFSHETALYLLELTDRSPLFYSVTVPTGYNATSLKAGGAKVFFVNRDLYLLGLTSMKSPHGNDIKTFNLERTICDVLRSKNRVDVQLINESLKRYVGKKERNIDLLYSYALQFSIQKIVRETIEVLL
jgi:predicted transcriptional regulator of viral defense system